MKPTNIQTSLRIFGREYVIFDLCVVVISLSLLAQFLITYPLWQYINRTFPHLPVLASLPLASFSTFDLIDYIACTVLLLLLVFMPARRNLLITFLVLAALLLLQDLNRLQVWVYQFFAMLLVLAMKREGNERYVFQTLQLIVVATYFWSGFHKINVYFVSEVFPSLLQHIPQIEFLLQHQSIGYSAAAFETLIALGLLWPKSRRVAIVFAVIFHLIILYLIGPFGKNWNMVIWPWNITMIFLVVLLFWTNHSIKIFKHFVVKLKKFPVFAYVLVFFGILPLLNVFGRWDEQLSFKMYAGTAPQGAFFFDKEDRFCIPQSAKNLFENTNADNYKISLEDWAKQELGTPPYATHRSYKALGRDLCGCIRYKERAGVEIIVPNPWNKSTSRTYKYTCTALMD